jgi:hypothetical protein
MTAPARGRAGGDKEASLRSVQVVRAGGRTLTVRHPARAAPKDLPAGYFSWRLAVEPVTRPVPGAFRRRPLARPPRNRWVALRRARLIR